MISIVDEELNLIKEKVGLLPEGIQKKISELETAFDDGKFYCNKFYPVLSSHMTLRTIWHINKTTIQFLAVNRRLFQTFH